MTLKRIRVYAPVIAITLWSVWIIDVSGAGVVDRLGKLKGTDFIQFYIGGSFLLEGRADLLYDARAQTRKLRPWLLAHRTSFMSQSRVRKRRWRSRRWPNTDTPSR